METLEPSSEESSVEAIEQPAKVAEVDSPVPATAQPSDLQIVMGRLEHIEQALRQLTDQVGLTAERVEPLSRQVRQLGNKVDSLEESVSHPRIRDLLNGLILLHDLTDQQELDNLQTYEILRDQIEQILRINGVLMIPEREQFDPALHKAIEVVPCDTPEDNGKIIRVYRQGFRTQQTILRYAEVIVYSHHSPSHGE